MDLAKSTALKVRLVALNDGDDIPERIVRLSTDVPLTIGRASSNRGVAASSGNTKVENKVISKEHALIRTDSAGENVFIKDLKSMHGTKVDGVEVPRGEEVRVASGVELQFGVNVIRGSETFRPAMFRLEYQLWDTRPRSPSPYFYKPPVDGELKRGYTDEMSSYSDNEDDGACVIIPDTFEEVNDNGPYNEETSSLFGEISENDSSYSEGEQEPEMHYPDESESEDAESDSESHDSTFLGPIMLRSTTPGGPTEIDLEEQESKAPEILKRFQNSISDLVDEQPQTIPNASLEHLLHPERDQQPSKVPEEPHDEGPQDKSAPEAVEDVQCVTVRREKETFVDAHQKVDNLIADALAEVQKAQVQDSKSLESMRPRPQKRTADQAELDSIDTLQSNAVHVTKDVNTKVQAFAESPRKRTTAQYLRSFARDTTIFAAGSLAMLVGLAKLPNSLAP